MTPDFGDLAYRSFRGQLAFPIARTVIGIAIIGICIWRQTREADLSRRLPGLLPIDIRALIDARLA